MLHLVTGGAGFVGINLIDRLLTRGHRVIDVDNCTRGRLADLQRFTARPDFHFIAVDCADLSAFRNALASVISRGEIGEVWHLAANSDIAAGIADPTIDCRDTFMTTFNTLMIMRELEAAVLRFSSSSAIYGDHGHAEIREDTAVFRPISNYGAMKLASEAQISAAVEAFLERADIFRFPNVVGTPATHGVIYDLVRKLRATPDRLDVLGDGTQQKPYMHVEELLDAMLFIAGHATSRFNEFNIGPRGEGVTVRFIAETVRDAVSPRAEIRFGKGDRGWLGDVPKFRYSTKRLDELGWRPKLDSAEAVRRAVHGIVRQELHP
jgi:UDP-glucose 4-epimerase